MSTESSNGMFEHAARFASDYMFRNSSLPNNATVYSESHVLNNTQGRLLLTGVIDKDISLTGTNALTITLEYQEGDEWKNFSTLLSVSADDLIASGKVFEFIPPPSNTRRIFRLAVTANFDASDVNITSVIEALPLA